MNLDNMFKRMLEMEKEHDAMYESNEKSRLESRKRMAQKLAAFEERKMERGKRFQWVRL